MDSSTSTVQRLTTLGKAAISRSRQVHSFSSKSYRRTMSSSSDREKHRGRSSSSKVFVTVAENGSTQPSLRFEPAWPVPKDAVRRSPGVSVPAELSPPASHPHGTTAVRASNRRHSDDSHPSVIVVVNQSSGKAYRLNSHAMPATIHTAAWS